MEHQLDILLGQKSKIRLRKECETIKINLSFQEKTEILVESLFDDVDFECTITKNLFESILTGGAKIPKIKEMFSEFLET